MSSIVDLRGQKFDLLTPLAVVGFNSQRNTIWLCQCDCGKTKTVAANYLRRKDRYKSCGCSGRNHSDCIIGQRFGHWTVKEKTKNNKGKKAFLCECDCGNVKLQSSSDLINKKTRSCGCANLSKGKKKNSKIYLGERSIIKKDHPLYAAWLAMKQRCENPSDRKWPRYGARGIKVCSRWQNFAFFVKDMQPRPDGMSLDRIDNNGNYEPSNCRWATPRTQAQNTRRNIFVKKDGITLCLSEWARRMNVTHSTIKSWVQNGWGSVIDNPSN